MNRNDVALDHLQPLLLKTNLSQREYELYYIVLRDARRTSTCKTLGKSINWLAMESSLHMSVSHAVGYIQWSYVYKYVLHALWKNIRFWLAAMAKVKLQS